MAIRPYISEQKIKERLDQLACEINRDYADEELVVLGILNGAFIFVADLVRRLNMPLEVGFMLVESYGQEKSSSGKVEIKIDLQKEITGKHVLLVEDIVDTGLTMKEVKSRLSAKSPTSLKLACLLYKPARNQYPVDIDYLAFEIEDHFVVGYGLDYAQRYRQLPFVGLYSDD